MTRRASWSPAVTVIMAVTIAVLAGCAGIPGTGPVVAGQQIQGAGPEALRFEALGPTTGMSPDEIVTGFVTAMGQVDDPGAAVARQYLTAAASRRWSPRSRLVVYTGAPSASIEGDRATVSVTAVADIKAGGRYVPRSAGDDRDQVVSYTVAREDGQWRLSDVTDGTLVSQAQAGRVLKPYRVYFGDPRAAVDGIGRYLVPDVRWFPARVESATQMAQALLDPASAPLLGSVTAVTVPGLRLGEQGVEVRNGVATVDLTSQLRDAEPAQATLLRIQLERTLTALPGIREVRLTVEGTLVRDEDDDAAAPLTEAVVSARPYVLLAGDVSDAATEPTATEPTATEPTGEPGAEPSGPDVQVATAADRSIIAQVSESGAAVEVESMRRLAERIDSGLAVSPEDPRLFAGLGDQGTRMFAKSVTGPVEALVTLGVDLTPPSIDLDGWVWTVSQGAVSAASEPTAPATDTDGAAGPRILAVRATSPAEPVDVESSGLLRPSDRVTSLRVSRDGTRALIVVQGADNTVSVLVAGVNRDRAGRPLSLSASYFPLLPDLVSVVDATWVQSDTVAVLGSAGSGDVRPFVAQVGGVSTELSPVADAVSISSAIGERTIVVGRSDRTLVSRVGRAWSKDSRLGWSPAF